MDTLTYTQDQVNLIIRLKTKKKETDTVLHALYETIAPTHKEEGCLEYRVLQEDRSILVMGRWKNRMSLDMHLLLQFHLHLFEELLPPLCKKISVSIYKELEPPITALSLRDD